MKVLLTLALLLCWLKLSAQEPARVYADTAAHYQLMYLSSWRRLPTNELGEVVFSTAATPSPVTVTIRRLALPAPPPKLGGVLLRNHQDSVWHQIQRLPHSQVVYLMQHDAGSQQEVQYQYTYAASPAPAPRTRVVGRRIWRQGVAVALEYRAATVQDARYLAEGEKLLESFRFVSTAPRVQQPAASSSSCDEKMYAIAALRSDNAIWEDDCQTIHEFSAANLSARPKVHWRVLPFQSYALAKGFDNCLYSVTKSPTNTPERVYRYNPATRKGEYTPWRLPAQGLENVWISAATDVQGSLYFMTSDASKLVKVNPVDGAVTTLWTTDPLRQAPFYSTIGFTGAGTHGNFCLDENRTLYQVYSTDGSVMRVNLDTRQPVPALTTFTGLPERGGYSDLLFQTDGAGRRWLYMAGPKASTE
ncbi:hypothetical protein [Hymenobacter sp. AT01-02]|uniref:hypothetical protein n=1 Tax=Hymenobacter sp. AT01-02 TaxID=1571877 RepID=UPI0006E2843A|nr:hypothetical protein [Hymenobacter sp. AT01-02]